MEITYDGEFLRRRSDDGSYRMERIDPDEMLLICAAYSAHTTRERHAREKAAREAGQVWLAHYMRHSQQHQHEYFSLKDAVSFLWGGAESCSLQPLKITRPDGTVILGDELAYQLEKYEENR